MSGGEPTRTLLVVTPFPLVEGGGLGSYASVTIDALIGDHGWRVVLVTSGSHRWSVQREDIGALRIYRLPYEIQSSNTRFGVRWRRQLKGIITDECPTVVNVHAPTPGLADVAVTVVGDIPFVVTYHAGSMQKGRQPADLCVGLYERILCRRLLARATWIISTSDFLRDSFLIGFRAKCSTIAPGVDIDRYTPGTPTAGRVLFVGGLRPADEHKGLDQLLGSIAALAEGRADLSLHVVGGGEDLGRYQERCRTLGIQGQVRFLGQLSGMDLLAAYQSASVLALPTTNDNFPMVLLEAMACAVPVVSTTIGGIPSMVEDGRQGFLVAPGDALAFTDRLGQILDDPELARRMGETGRDTAKRLHTWRAKTVRTNTILEAIASGRPGEGKHRLAVVAPKFRPTIGGLEEYAYQIALGFNEREDYDVVVLTSNHQGHRTVIEVVDGLTIFRFPRWFKVSETPINLLWPWRLKRTMADNRIDIVNAHTPVPFMVEAAAVASGSRPLVITYHAGSMIKGKPIPDLLIRLYEHRVLPRLLRRADAVVSVSAAAGAAVRAQPVEKSFLVRPGVDSSRFVPPDSHGGPPVPTLLFVGRIDRSSAWKGINYLVTAFAAVLEELPDARLVLVGGGDALEDHRQLAVSLGLSESVEFRGILNGVALVRAYQQASVLVLPSTTDSEASPMAVIEAMACGKPVIASNVGGIPFVVDDGGDGLLVPPADPAALATTCLKLLRSPDVAAEMGHRGYLKIQALSWSSRVAEYDAIFQRLLRTDAT